MMTPYTLFSSTGLRRGRQVLNIISNFFQGIIALKWEEHFSVECNPFLSPLKIFSLSLSKDKSFAKIYRPHSMVVKSSWDPIFLEFELKDDAPDAELFLDDCWLTGSEEFSSTSQWNFIVDGQVAVTQHSVIALAT